MKHGKTYYEISGNSYVIAALTVGTSIPKFRYFELNPNNERYSAGTNKYDESNIAQWLNAETEYNWFEKKNLWDSCLIYKNGFFVNIELILKKLIIPITRTFSYSGKYGNKQITKSYKIFFPQVFEIDGNTQSSEMTLGQWNYFKNTDNRIKNYNGSVKNWWCMSTNKGSVDHGSDFYCFNGSYTYIKGAKESWGIAPCFCI